MKILRHIFARLIYHTSPWRYDKMSDGQWTFRREVTCRCCGHSFTTHVERLPSGLQEVS